MLTRKDFLAASGLAALALPLAACSSDETDDATASDSADETDDTGGASDGASATTTEEAVTIRLGDQKIFLFSYAQERGILDELFADQNVELEVYDIGNGPALNEAFAADQIDFAYMAGFPALTGSTSYGYKLIATGLQTYQDGILVAAAGSGIESISDLAGRMVGTTIGGSYHYSTYLYLESAGLTFDDIELYNTSTETTASLRAGELDAGVIGLANATTLETEGSGTIVADSTGELSYVLLCAGADFIEEHAELAQLVVLAYDAVLRYRDENLDDYLAYYEEKTGSDSTSTASTWDHNDHWANVPGPQQLASASRLLAWMQDNDYAEAGLTVDDVFDTTVAEAAGLEVGD